MSLTVEVQGLDALITDVGRAGGNAVPLMKAAITNSVNRIQSNTRAIAPHRTGTLQRSIQTQVDYPQGEVSVGEKYGIWLEEGTGIYGDRGSRITPKTAKVLAWKGSSGLVFARSIAGMKARPFFRPGVEKSADYVAEQFVKVIERLVTGLAGRGF